MCQTLSRSIFAALIFITLPASAISVFDVKATRRNKPNFHQVGNHIIAEFKDCKRNLNNLADLPAHLTKAANDCGATLLDIETHQFDPEGVSGIAILSESHIALHTWPEYDYVAVDIFTCGDHIDLEKALEVLVDFYQPEDLTYIEFDRGFLEQNTTNKPS